MQRSAVLSALTGLLLLGAGACSEPGRDPVDERYVSLAGDGFEARFDLERGTFDVSLDDGTVVLERAFAEVEVRGPDGGESAVFRTTSGYVREASSGQEQDELGRAERVEIRFSGLDGAPDLALALAAYDGRPFLTCALNVENNGPGEIVLVRTVPAKVDATRRGGLWLGAHPSTHRILESGSFFLFDFFVDLVPGDVEEGVETVGLEIVHGCREGHSISNWNQAIRDQESGLAFVAGSLDFEHASPMLITSFDPEDAAPAGGRTPFTRWSAEFPYLPSGKPLGPGESLAAGPVAIFPGTVDAFEGLETYASLVKQFNGIRLWTERGADNRVPTGWNSWSGSGSSGGYGTGIDQQLMIDNLDVMATEFKDFGGEWFQIDDGYEYFYGDWDWREDRFPEGSAWMAGQIEDRGLIPGIWIAIFQVDELSETHARHADDGWFADGIPMFSGDKPILDLTHPEVLQWLTARFRKIRAEGYRWIKTDFGYYALAGRNLYDSTVTREEAFHRGLAAIRAGLDQGALDAGGSPGDTFWLTVGMLGPHLGYTDSLRPNLDTMPAWDSERQDDGRKEAQGFKPTVRIIARRYYLQNKVYIFNHDLIFFRSNLDPSVPRITADESRCLVTAIGLSGGVAKLGERLLEMEPAGINDYRRILPVFGRAARPCDLFEREFPEMWHLRVVPSEGLNTNGAGPAYDVVALFNWGTNVDLTTNPYTAVPDEARTLSLDLADVGLDPQAEYVARDFWSGEVLDSVGGTLTRTVQPHTVQLFALREKKSRPQYIGGNRHLLQGAVEVRSIDWDAGPGSLTLAYDAAPGSEKAPFAHELDFLVPGGWSVESVTVDGASPGTVRTEQDGPVLSLGFEVETRRVVGIELAFSAP